ncbi:MAG: hypothetical protein CL944_01545 [Candidatus Diapherotrites archaeon]|uniref:Uncharacterized protein n=1 Tax=Candidatus Iainarchaeum sp. TaxID=3101447 RepID=A0A2D6LPM9_9ARCH|nr:hypothetical protein [Candidatus Diapherotrites archaeon]|tara:strand:+ start:6106 stop:6540 length:435 start_codon:yes stop_codon:yes gene_type:complete
MQNALKNKFVVGAILVILLGSLIFFHFKGEEFINSGKKFPMVIPGAVLLKATQDGRISETDDIALKCEDNYTECIENLAPNENSKRICLEAQNNIQNFIEKKSNEISFIAGIKVEISLIFKLNLYGEIEAADNLLLCLNSIRNS